MKPHAYYAEKKFGKFPNLVVLEAVEVDTVVMLAVVLLVESTKKIASVETFLVLIKSQNMS